MDVILYNPLSKAGNNKKIAEKIVKKLNKKNIETEIVDITKIDDVNEFLITHQKAKRFIIVGGDGTLNVLANTIKDVNIKQDIYLYKAGSGNDFARSLKQKGKLISIKEYFYNLPVVKFEDKEKVFLNGIGLGLDGLVVYKVNQSKAKNNKANYFKNAIIGFKEYKPNVSKVIVNNKTIDIKKTWFVAVMNDKYFGGGMKLAPKASRDKNELSLVIVKDVPKWLLFLIFPTIYLGIHTMFKRYIKIIKTNEVSITFEESQYLQIDGEDYKDIKHVNVTHSI